jgi:hypothetical protein
MKFNSNETKDKMTARWSDILREVDGLRKQAEHLIANIEEFANTYTEDLCFDMPKEIADNMDGSALDIAEGLISDFRGDITFRIGSASVSYRTLLSKLTVEDAVLVKRVSKLREIAEKTQNDISGLFTATRVAWDVIPYTAIPHEKKDG